MPPTTFLLLGIATSVPWSIAISFKMAWALDSVKGNVGLASAVYLTSSLLVFLVAGLGWEADPATLPRRYCGVNALALAVQAGLCLSPVEGMDFFLPLLGLTAVYGASAAAFQLLVFARAAQYGEIGSFTVGFSLAATCTALYVLFVCPLNERYSAVAALVAGSAMLLGCMVCVPVPPSPATLAVSSASGSASVSASEGPPKHPSATQPFLLLTSLFLCIASTLLAFPGLVTRIESSEVSVGQADCAFTGTLLTLFNVGDLLGRAMANSLMANALSGGYNNSSSRRTWPWFLLTCARGTMVVGFFHFQLGGSSNNDGSGAMDLEDVGGGGLWHDDGFVRAFILLFGWTQGLLYAVLTFLVGAWGGEDVAQRARLGKWAATTTNVALAVGSVLGGWLSSVL